MILSRLVDITQTLRALLRQAARKNTKGNLDEELKFHLEMSAQSIQTASGVSAEEARRRALIEFGGVERSREETYRQRPGWLLETIAQDTRYALRGFRRNPAFTATVIATLALGIGATTAVFSVVDRILFRALPYADDSRLVSVGLAQPLEKQEFMLGGFYYEWRDGQSVLSSMTFERGTQECNLTESNPVHLNCGEIAENFLPTLGVAPVLGRNFISEEDRPNGPSVALISDALWLSRFNRDPGVLNRTISIDEHPVRIVGVLPPSFEMPRMQSVDILRPAQVDIFAQHTLNSGIGLPMWAFGRLKPGISIAQARLQLEPQFKKTQQWIPAQFRNEFHLQVRSVRDRQMESTYTAAWVFLGAVLVVLMIACANVASLFLTRAAARERELAVRSALGASRSRLIRQTLTEALLLAIAGAAAGCALAEALLRAFLAIAPTGVPFLAKARLDPRIVLFTLLAAFVCAFFCGILPALQKPRSSALAARSAKSPLQARLRQILVAAQIAFSLVLLSSATLLLKSFWNLQQQDLGLTSRNVLTVRIPFSWERYPHGPMDFYLRAEAALRRLPGVTAVGMSNSLPPDDGSWHDGRRYADLFVVGKPPHAPGIGGNVVTRSVTPDYFRVLGIAILQGRGFTEEERTSTGNFIVLSKLLASRLFSGEDPIGQRMQFGTYKPYFVVDPPVYTIVGVAADVKNAGLSGQDDPEYYTVKSTRNPDDWNRYHHFLLQSSLPEAAMAPWIRAQIAQLDPTVPVEIESMSQSVNKLADRPRFEAALVGFFAGCGLAMAVIGLYGVIAYSAAQRTQEIGVRMALGATRADILRLISGEGMRLIALGATMGVAVALATAQLLKSLLFHVQPRDPGIIAGAACLLGAVALLATLIPARRAMRVNPMEALRCE
jgi:predicted permease